jgi:hypothetical protein
MVVVVVGGTWRGHGVELQSDVDEFGRDVDDDVLIRVLVEIGRVDEQGRRIFGQERGERDGVSWRSGERESWWRGICGMWWRRKCGICRQLRRGWYVLSSSTRAGRMRSSHDVLICHAFLLSAWIRIG